MQRATDLPVAALCVAPPRDRKGSRVGFDDSAEDGIQGGDAIEVPLREVDGAEPEARHRALQFEHRRFQQLPIAALKAGPVRIRGREARKERPCGERGAGYDAIAQEPPPGNLRQACLWCIHEFSPHDGSSLRRRDRS